MSFRVCVTFVCDACGAELAASDHRIGSGFQAAMDALRYQAERGRWRSTKRKRYQTDQHYCGGCAADAAGKPR